MSTIENSYTFVNDGDVSLYFSDYATADELESKANKLLSQKRFGDGWAYHDETIGRTRGIVLSVSDYVESNSDIAARDGNLEVIKSHMAGLGEEGDDWDLEFISGFGGTYALVVKVYEDLCPEGGDHGWFVNYEVEHGYEDVQGFEDEIVFECRDCGAQYVGDEYDGELEYTQAFLGGFDLSKGLEEGFILDETDHSDRISELVDKDVQEIIDTWSINQDDLAEDQAEEIAKAFYDLDKVPSEVVEDEYWEPGLWEYIEGSWGYGEVSEESVCKLLDYLKEEWYVRRGQENLSAQIDGQMELGVL